MTIAMANNPRLRIAVLCILYCAQGIPHGFVTIALIAWLVERGVDTTGVAMITGASVLPWSFKWAWGPIVDRYQIPEYGRRRPWIIFAQMLMILSAFTLTLVPDPVQALGTLATAIFLHNVFSGLQDVSVDALAVDLLRPEERGRANGLMYGSKYAGTALGAAGLGAVLARSDGSLFPAVGLMMLALAVIMCVPLCIRERPGEKRFPFGDHASGHLVHDAKDVNEESVNASVADLMVRLFRAFGRRNTLLAAVLGFLIWIPNGMTYPVSMTLFIQELGWTQESYSNLTGTYGIAAGLTGSIVGGFLADLIGARTLAGFASVMMGCMLGMFGLAPDAWWNDTSFVSVYLVAEQGIQGMLSVSLFAIFMSVSWKVVAATQFTAYMALLNLSYSFGNAASPWLEGIGVRNVFLLAAVIQIMVVLVLPFCSPSREKTTPDDGVA